VLVVVGGIQGARTLRHWVKSAQAQQRQLAAELAGKPRGKPPPKVAVDALFLRRLATIFKM